MPPTYLISLTVFEQTIATDPMILGMLYTGPLECNRPVYP